jgi:hypothetical protein
VETSQTRWPAFGMDHRLDDGHAPSLHPGKLRRGAVLSLRPITREDQNQRGAAPGGQLMQYNCIFQRANATTKAVFKQYQSNVKAICVLNQCNSKATLEKPTVLFIHSFFTTPPCFRPPAAPL